MSVAPALEQISISLSLERKSVAPATSVSARRCESEREILLKDVLSHSVGPWAFNLPELCPPFRMCTSLRFMDRVRQVHRLLRKALIDIVERWPSDTEAGFPGRMPLEAHEEELLRWMVGPGHKYVRSFNRAHGIWRTDFLIERASDGLEMPKMREINARLPYNGCWMAGMLTDATKLFNKSSEAFLPHNDFEETKKIIFELFDKTQPLCHIREKWPGVDSPFFLKEWAANSGSKTFTIKPSQLRSREDSSSVTGRSLYRVPDSEATDVNATNASNGVKEDGANGVKDSSDVNGEDVTNSMSEEANPSSHETITQCSVELFQEELQAIDTETLHQLATCCTNDFRESLIVHDKRLLCILREELPNLVKRGILTEDERSLLQEATIEL